jgi:transposase
MTMAVLPTGYVRAQARAERRGAEAIRIIATAIRAAQRSGKSEGRRTEGCMKSPGFRVVSHSTFHTLLRLARRATLPDRPTPTALGVDEWAYRKGQDYKTILVDLDTHRPIDLLPAYTAAAFAAWLQAHPGVNIIARDRAGTFADGAAQGAPDAVQVADRFHLMKNLREALEPILDRLTPARQAAADMLVDAALATAPRQTPGVVETNALSPAAAEAPRPLPASGLPRPPYLERLQRHLRAKRKQRYDQVVALHEAGKGVRTIARELHMNRQTIRRFVLALSFPEHAPRPAVPSKLDPYAP